MTKIHFPDFAFYCVWYICVITHSPKCLFLKEKKKMLLNVKLPAKSQQFNSSKEFFLKYICQRIFKIKLQEKKSIPAR